MAIQCLTRPGMTCLPLQCTTLPVITRRSSTQLPLRCAALHNKTRPASAWLICLCGAPTGPTGHGSPGPICHCSTIPIFARRSRTKLGVTKLPLIILILAKWSHCYFCLWWTLRCRTLRFETNHVVSAATLRCITKRNSTKHICLDVGLLTGTSHYRT